MEGSRGEYKRLTIIVFEACYIYSTDTIENVCKTSTNCFTTSSLKGALLNTNLYSNKKCYHNIADAFMLLPAENWLQSYLERECHDLHTYKSVYVIYNKNDYKPIYSYVSGGNSEMLAKDIKFHEEYNFTDYLMKENCKSFSDVVFSFEKWYIITSQNNFELNLESDIKLSTKNESIIDELLSFTRGRLVWHRQFEQLINLFGIDFLEAEKTRRAFHKKKFDDCQMLHKIVIDNYSLFDIIASRMLSKYLVTHSCVLDPAYKIYSLMVNTVSNE